MSTSSVATIFFSFHDTARQIIELGTPMFFVIVVSLFGMLFLISLAKMFMSGRW